MSRLPENAFAKAAEALGKISNLVIETDRLKEDLATKIEAVNQTVARSEQSLAQFEIENEKNLRQLSEDLAVRAEIRLSKLDENIAAHGKDLSLFRDETRTVLESIRSIHADLLNIRSEILGAVNQMMSVRDQMSNKTQMMLWSNILLLFTVIGLSAFIWIKLR